MSAPDPVTALPTPTPDADTRPYWEGLATGELRLQRCLDCRRFQHFPAPICSTCGSFGLGFEPVSGRGTVETFVVIEHTTSAAFAARAPITVAWVELPEQAGLRVLTDIVGCEPLDVRIGMPVELVLDRHAFTATEEQPIPIPLPRFRPVPTAPGA